MNCWLPMHGESGPLCNTFELIGVIESSLESVYCYHHICFQHMAPGPARYPQLIKCISENTLNKSLKHFLLFS